jgi:hypothetical protein
LKLNATKWLQAASDTLVREKRAIPEVDGQHEGEQYEDRAEQNQ